MIFLDSDFIIALARGEEKVYNMLIALEKKDILATTVINYFEVLSGAMLSNKKEKRVEQANMLLNRLEIVELNKEASILASKVHADLIRKGTPLSKGDLFIGSIALHLNSEIVTRNTKDFKRIPGLKVVGW